MQSFELIILGCSSATPTSSRNPSAQLLNVAERFFLIDCGEGTQIQLRRFKIKFQRINHICISHLHGDHYLGLIGLLASMHLLGRTADLHLYAPAELKEIIDIQHKHSQTFLNYKIVFHPLKENSSEIIFEDEKLSVETIVLNHRIPCWGFLFKEKPLLPNIDTYAIEKYHIPIAYIPKIKAGGDFKTEDGKMIKNEKLIIPAPTPRTYAYCSDTCYDESLLPQIKNADVLYHEATFMNDRAERAKTTFHSTTLQAATIAKKAQVKKLIIGHFSARYNELEPLLQETKSVFDNSFLAIEGEKHKI